MLIKYIKSVLWRVAKLLSYTEDARCLKVNILSNYKVISAKTAGWGDLVGDERRCHTQRLSVRATLVETVTFTMFE